MKTRTNKLLHWLLLFTTVIGLAQPAHAQTRYVKEKLADGTFKVYRETTSGTSVFRTQVSRLPTDAARSRKAGLNKNLYALEGVRQLNHAQWPSGKYFDPNFALCIDYRPDNLSLNELRAKGQNLFSNQQTIGNEYHSLPFPQGIDYNTEASLHGNLEGAGYWESSLETIEQKYQNTVGGAIYGYYTPNIETSGEWWPGNESSPLPGYPQGSYGRTHYNENWSTAKNKTITLESTGEQNISLDALANRGVNAWIAEKHARRGNRTIVLMETALRKSPPGAYVAYGASMYQGIPDKGRAYQNGAFYESHGTGSIIGGDAQGNKVLNGRSYKLAGSFYDRETVHMDYYYNQYFHITQADHTAIWVNQEADKVNYPYIWSKILPYHVVADQIGHFQANDIRMRNRGGNINRGTLLLREALYENNMAGIVDGLPGIDPNQGPGRIGRVPTAMNAGCIDFTPNDGVDNCNDAPKIWMPPYEIYSYYVCARFFYANRPGSGLYFWNAPGHYNLNPTTGQVSNNHHLHSVSALLQARHDMQPYERMLGQSTLVETPQVQALETGNFESYDAIQAYNEQDGSKGPQKPVYQLRYLAKPGGFRVLVLGGMNQAHGTERIDRVRYTLPGMSGPVTMRVKLRGPAAHVYEFSVSSADANQVYEALPTAQALWEKAGYAGRVGSATN